MPCEVCGSRSARLFLRSERLDGPLVRCPGCGLLYVGSREHDFTFASADPARSARLGELVDRLAIVDRGLEEAPDTRAQVAEREHERLRELLRFAVPEGALLDVGASTGEFLRIARERFRVQGVEPDPGTAAQARADGLDVLTGTLGQLPPGPRYDAITMFHVIEHLDSPRAALERVRSLLRPGGVVLLETPSSDNLWFALAPARWRQLIPDHYFFFSPATLGALVADVGLRVREHRTVSRRVSLAFAADRLRRAGVPGARLLGGVLAATGQRDRRLRIDPGDIMQLVAELPATASQTAT